MNPMDLAASLIADDRQLPLDLVFQAQQDGLFADGDYQAAYDRMMGEALEAAAAKLEALLADDEGPSDDDSFDVLEEDFD
ncbi:hypothetical protein UFOVP347_5 [uncultured Caudovirales phage]|uniref:Uncharacterized protein n=1 Tax=uncultured Caudovirales phage TaxID=2100421 RepID=A0A6J5LZ80_9CAUD|nr:hypothetical protein UFOVP347_5 [uncultured Caudovirales phage]